MNIQKVEMKFYDVESGLFSSKEKDIRQTLDQELSENVDFVYKEVKSLPYLKSKPPFLSTTSTIYMSIIYKSPRSWNTINAENLERIHNLFKKVEELVYEDNIDINYVREKNDLKLYSFIFQNQILKGRFTQSNERLPLKPQELYVSILFTSKHPSKKEIEELKETYSHVDINIYPFDIDNFGSFSYSWTREPKAIVGKILQDYEDVDLPNLEIEFEETLKHYRPKNPFNPEQVRIRIIYQPEDTDYIFKTGFSYNPI